MNVKLSELAEKSNIKFGTSGIRGLAIDLTDFVCYSYTVGFLKYLNDICEIETNKSAISIGGDYRPSTDRIMNAIVRAVIDLGYLPLDCGKVPTPAISYYSFERRIPSIMVTGSHIPDDRNGIKFNKIAGEVLKDDEKRIIETSFEIPENLFNEKGEFLTTINLHRQQTIQKVVEDVYVKRYLDFFPKESLNGKKIGLYEHSSVGRDVIYRILSELGADVVKLGYSEIFIPVDTEAMREEDIIAAKKWIRDYKIDVIVSTDGDGDRPLISDEKGNWLRGDISGILCAKYLKAESVSTSITCNSAVEKCGWFKNVIRTKIGSPYIIESMKNELKIGFDKIVGYEANGGFLIGSKIINKNKILNPLFTRDAVITQLSIIILAINQNKFVSQLVNELPKRFTASDKIRNFPLQKSQQLLMQFSTDDEELNKKEIVKYFGKDFGQVKQIDRTDGIRILFQNNEIVHFRPSGNSPELRCYTEAASYKRVYELNAFCMELFLKKVNA